MKLTMTGNHLSSCAEGRATASRAAAVAAVDARGIQVQPEQFADCGFRGDDIHIAISKYTK